MSQERCCYHPDDDDCKCDCHRVIPKDDLSWNLPMNVNEGQQWLDASTGKFYKKINGQWEEHQFKYQGTPPEQKRVKLTGPGMGDTLLGDDNKVYEFNGESWEIADIHTPPPSNVAYDRWYRCNVDLDRKGSGCDALPIVMPEPFPTIDWGLLERWSIQHIIRAFAIPKSLLEEAKPSSYANARDIVEDFKRLKRTLGK